MYVDDTTINFNLEEFYQQNTCTEDEISIELEKINRAYLAKSKQNIIKCAKNFHRQQKQKIDFMFALTTQ